MWWSKLLSWVIGEVSPLDYILGALLIAVLGWSASLKLDVWSAESDLYTCKDQKEKMEDENGYLLTDKARYEEAIIQRNYDANISKEESKKETIIIHDRVKKEIKRIKELPYDDKKTDYENAIVHAERSGI